SALRCPRARFDSGAEVPAMPRGDLDIAAHPACVCNRLGVPGGGHFESMQRNEDDGCGTAMGWALPSESGYCPFGVRSLLHRGPGLQSLCTAITRTVWP